MKGIVGFFGASELMDIERVRPWVAANFPLMAYTPEQIVAASADWPEFDSRLDESGIYFLQRRGKICYIGKASSITLRLCQHKGRPFDAVTVIAGIPPDACTSLEMAYVQAWDPPWNRARAYGSFSAGDALRSVLAKMPLDLVCDQPELGRITDAEMSDIVAKLNF